MRIFPMARPSILHDPVRKNIILESTLHDAALKKVVKLRIEGGFSGYLSRLLVRDMRRKGSAANGVSRHLPVSSK